MQRESGAELLNALTMRMRELPDLNEHKLVFEVLESINLLLELDNEYRDEFQGEDSVSFMFE